MEEVYAFAFLILFTLAVAVMCLAEYLRTRDRYMALITGAVTTAAIWHLNNGALSTLDVVPPAGYILGNALLTAMALLLLRGYQHLLEVPDRGTVRLCTGAFVAIAIAYLLVGPDGAWAYRLLSLPAVLALLLPAWYILPDGRGQAVYWIMALFQLLLVLCYLVGVLYLLEVDREIGGVVYFLMSMLIPAIAILFFQASLTRTTRKMEISERNFRDLFESVRDTFFRIDDNGIIREISPSVAQFGYGRDPLIGSSLATLYEVPSKFEQDFTRMQREVSIPHMPVKVRTTSNDIRDSELSVTQITDDDGLISGYVGTIRDVDDRNQLERQFLDAQRRESMGVMAGGVAHDFNNILQGIVGHADWVLNAPDMPVDERNEHLRVILDASTTAASLCRQLLEYTGRSHSEMLPISLVSGVRNVLDMFRHSVPENIRVSTTVKDGSLVVNADATQLRQVTLNLLKNAIDAMDGRGEIRVRLGHEFFSKEELASGRPREHKMTEGPYAVLSVTDTGKGMDEATVERIFDPFYSTKSLGHGLGLAAVIGIVRSHDGCIIVDSAPGKGTTFKVLLPLSEARETFKSIRSMSDHNGEGHTILIVDDEEDIREIAERILIDRHYDTLIARDGEEAVKVFTANEAAISAVIMDVKMPRKDGITASREIRQQAPLVPILIASGYADIAGRITSAEALTYNFIAKPYRRQEILDALSSILEAPVAEDAQGQGKA